jgi:hypothetical protein
MSTTVGNQHRCIMCEQTSAEVPLISVEFRGETFRICPADLPILIHAPDRLVGKLAGAESLRPSDRHD